MTYTKICAGWGSSSEAVIDISEGNGVEAGWPLAGVCDLAAWNGNDGVCDDLFDVINGEVIRACPVGGTAKVCVVRHTATCQLQI